MISPFMLSKKKAKFIAIEGGEGSGKSTLMIALKEVLKDAVLTTREPGGSPYAEAIRNTALKNSLAGQASPATMLCLMFASRFDHVQNTIKPAIEKGISVITDRFDASSYAYNVWAQSDGALEETFWDLRKQLVIVPDIYIYVDVSVEEGLRRASHRNQSLLDGNHFDDRKIEFHNKVREGYKRFFNKIPCITIDANRSFEEVKRDFIKTIMKQLA